MRRPFTEDLRIGSRVANPSIQNISVFGSVTRNDLDELSDVDVLALVLDGGGTVPEQEIVSQLPLELQPKASISWYGVQKMSEMFQSGHLFAWHLFLESTPILGWGHLSERLGKPAIYQTALEDIDGLIELLHSSRAQFLNQSPNTIYELGLLYLVARNIAMSASWHLLTVTRFDRYSPFAIANTKFPLKLREYEILLKCRMASQRGISFSPAIKLPWAIMVCDELLNWAAKIRRKVKNEQKCT